MGSPAVTVVTPTYNRWDRIGPTLETVLAQTGVDLEWVIVSDGDQPMPSELLARTEGRARVIQPPVAQGVAHARNVGIKAAEGEWIAFLDDDDLWAPTKLATQVAAAREAGAGWAFATAMSVRPDMRPIRLVPAPPAEGLLPRLLDHQDVPAGCSNVLVHRDLTDRAGGFDESFYQLCDWDLWIRYAAESRPAPVDELLVAYVKHPTNMLLTHEDWVFAELNRLRRKHRRLGRSQGRPLNAKAFGYWVANSLEDAGHRRRALMVSAYAGLRYASRGLCLNAARIAARRPRPPWPGAVEPPPPPPWLSQLTAASAPR